jgi:hypothetical protein
LPALLTANTPSFDTRFFAAVVCARTHLSTSQSWDFWMLTPKRHAPYRPGPHIFLSAGIQRRDVRFFAKRASDKDHVELMSDTTIASDWSMDQPFN